MFWKMHIQTYLKYKEDLFGLLASLTSDDAKMVLKEMVDKGQEADGFLAIKAFNRKFEVKTAASLLQLYQFVVSPVKIQTLHAFCLARLRVCMYCVYVSCMISFADCNENHGEMQQQKTQT